MRKYFKKNFISIVSLIITIISLFLAYYWYTQSISEKQPVFAVDPAVTQILNAKNLSMAPIKVFKQDGEQIVNNIYANRVYFWNTGKQAIRKDDVLQDIILEIDNESAEILDFRILNMSREVTKFNLTPIATNKLLINFDILERNDGATIQIIYSAKTEVGIKLNGIIEGVQDIKLGRNIRTEIVRKYLFIFIFIIFIAILFNVLLDYLFSKLKVIVMQKISEMEKFSAIKKTLKNYKHFEKIFTYITLFIILAVISYLLIYAVSPSLITNEIPYTIAPK
ncbi:hypothetical protein [Abyssisolibacter fermentans]|uniref:hypothetical protein n=1 Tax=Abyssisolibacter fermentans TaxID=1766203 RepID=UPI0008374BE2|nr:hypothetical protein [Abyssisolibacter fermentans]